MNEETFARIHIMDLIKGILILEIILTHFCSSETALKYYFAFWVDRAVPMFMIISGYVSAKSMEKKGITSIDQAYKLSVILPKFIRYTIPLLLVFPIEWGCMLLTQEVHTVNPYIIFINFVQGGTGPGSYYYPLMIEFLIIFPVIYFIVKAGGYMDSYYALP